mgnify:CR=1 FL=1
MGKKLGRPKKTVEVSKKESVIHALSIDFNKEEFNTLVAKINEIITHLNK